MVIWAAAVPPVLLMQWSQATQLGFAVFDGGLLLAAVNYPVEEDEEEEYEDEDDEEHSEDEDHSDENAEDEPLDPFEEEQKRRRRMRGLA
jgi:hypothetical protein